MSEAVQLSEIFRSIQGESTWAGCPCVFVRLSGCNLRCAYCDTRYAHGTGPEISATEILGRVQALLHPGDIIELTGGEPLLQEASLPLVERLAELATVLVETNGSVRLPPPPRCFHAIVDVKCPSSGESERVAWENLDDLVPGDEVKFVVADERDFSWALEHIGDYPLLERGTPLLFAPVFGAVLLADLAGWILDTGLPLRLQLQQHKIIWPDCDRGV